MSVSQNQTPIVSRPHGPPSQLPAKVPERELMPKEVDIAKLAYERFVARGSIHGYDTEDWLSAERELKGRG